MITDGEATQDGFIFKPDLVHTIFMDINVEKNTFKAVVWLCHNDVPIEIYDGKRGMPFYDRLAQHIENVNPTISITVQDEGSYIIRRDIRIKYLQTILIKRNGDENGKISDIGQILISVRYDDITQHFTLYDGDMRTCYRIYDAIAKELDKVQSTKLIQVHGAVQ